MGVSMLCMNGEEDNAVDDDAGLELVVMKSY